MKLTIYNQKQLDVAIADLINFFDENKKVNLDYSKVSSPKTKNQLGFFFGGLADSVVNFFNEQGTKISVDEAKENFYDLVAKMDSNFITKTVDFYGNEKEVPLRISKMNAEQMSVFIDTCIYLVDNFTPFEGLYLHPSLRYTWVRNLTEEDKRGLQVLKPPREDKEYLSYVRTEPCIWCGVSHQSEAHHIKIVGETGTGYKADDWATVPLCHKCHIGSLHQKGVDEFLKDLEWITKYISLRDFCLARWNRWRNKK